MEGGVKLPGRKRKEECGEEDGGRTKIAAVSEWGAEEVEEDLEKMQVEEDMVAAVMKWLEEEISAGPSSSSVGDGGNGFYYQAPSFVTINGNEESCGPSFSDAASTVMASVDTRGLAGPSYFATVPPDAPELQATIGLGPWCGGRAATAAPAAVEEEEEDGDAWLARVLGGPAFELEDNFL